MSLHQESFEAGRAKGREECWNEINALIKSGPLPGNGTDKTAERNGLILACNVLLEGGGKAVNEHL